MLHGIDLGSNSKNSLYFTWQNGDMAMLIICQNSECDLAKNVLVAKMEEYVDDHFPLYGHNISLYDYI